MTQPAESQLHNLEQAAKGIGLYMNSDKTELIWFIQDDPISYQICKPLKLVNQFIYLGTNISSTENDASIVKAWSDIERLMTIWNDQKLYANLATI